MNKTWREVLIILVAIAVVVAATYSLSQNWLAVGLVFLSGIGLGAVWLVVQAIHAVTGHKR